MEYAYGEASLKSSDDDKKNQFDSKLKTMKSMKDMLHYQLNSVDKGSNIKSLLRSVGYQFNKFTIIILYMDFIGEHVCRVRKADPIIFQVDIQNFLASYIEIFKLGINPW